MPFNVIHFDLLLDLLHVLKHGVCYAKGFCVGQDFASRGSNDFATIRELSQL